MISQRDGKIVFKYWKNSQDEDFLGGFGDSNKIFLFHSMNMHMPLDFIIMFYMVQNRENDIESLNNYYNQIEVADQQLDAVLKVGVAENHLHKGVSVSFFEIWDAFMMPLGSYAVKAIRQVKLDLSDRSLEEGEVLFFILTPSIVRIWIALELTVGFREDEVKHEIFSYFQEQWEIILQILSKISESRTFIQEIFAVLAYVHTSDETIFFMQ